MALKKEDLLKRANKTQKVLFSDGEFVFIRPLPANMFISEGGEAESDSFRTERLVVRSLCDEDGAPWFSDDDPMGGQVLNLPLADFNKLTQACLDINGLRTATDDKVSAAEKN